MKLSHVSKNYDSASRYYDRLTDMVFGHLLGLEKYRGQTIKWLGKLDGATVLDIGCGTGRNFPLLVEKVGRRGRIIGVDYSEGMLKQAHQRIQARGWRNIDLIRDDAAQLKHVQGPVDAVTAMWSLGIVYDLNAALNRAMDLLRPGGSLSIMDFGKSRPDHGLLRWLFPIYSLALRKTGIDSTEDLDNTRLEAKWARGKGVIKERLCHLKEKHYLKGVGLIIAGKKPERK